jgi:hypothetical protein
MTYLSGDGSNVRKRTIRFTHYFLYKKKDLHTTFRKIYPKSGIYPVSTIR